METKNDLIKMAISNFESIADQCNHITSGNIAHQAATIKGIASRNAQYLRENHSQSEGEIEGVIISRELLAEYGYDPDQPTDEQMQIIANKLLEYWGMSGGFKDALASIM